VSPECRCPALLSKTKFMGIFPHHIYKDSLVSLRPSAVDISLTDIQHPVYLGQMTSMPLSVPSATQHLALRMLPDTREQARLKAQPQSSARSYSQTPSLPLAELRAQAQALAQAQAQAQAQASNALDSLLDLAAGFSPLWPTQGKELSLAHTVSTTCASASICTAGEDVGYSIESRQGRVVESNSPRAPTSPQSLSRPVWPTKAEDYAAATGACDVVSSLHDLELALSSELSPGISLDIVPERGPNHLWSPSTVCSPRSSFERNVTGDIVSGDLLNGVTHLAYEPTFQNRLDHHLPCSPVTPSAPITQQAVSATRDFDQSLNQKTRVRPTVRKPKTYAKPIASRFCHICSRMPRRGQGAAVCRNMEKGLCRKIVCERCIVDNGWNYDMIKSNSSSWLCPHCSGLCPSRSQCHIYNRINARRKRADDLADDGSTLAKATSAITSMSSLQASCLASADLASSYAFLLGPNQADREQALLFGSQSTFPVTDAEVKTGF
jgi:hypothetical protein